MKISYNNYVPQSQYSVETTNSLTNGKSDSSTNDGPIVIVPDYCIESLTKSCPLSTISDSALIGNDDILFGFLDRTTQLTNITLYNSELGSNKKPIYIEFANATSLKDAISFSIKYGPIVNPRLVPNNRNTNRTYSLLTNLKEENTCSPQYANSQTTLYDCTLYKHFLYYQTQMRCLIDLHRLLNTRHPENNIEFLANTCRILLKNEYFEEAFALEYDEMPYYEIYPSFFSFNPVIQYIYQRDFSIQSKEIFFPDMSLNALVKSLLLDNNNEYVYKNPLKLIKLSQYLFSNILSFAIRDVRPIVNYTNPKIDFNWTFNSLADALFFYFYIDHSVAKKFAICANETCNNLFYLTKSTPTKKFCCWSCAHRTANRNSKRNKHAEKIARTVKESEKAKPSNTHSSDK